MATALADCSNDLSRTASAELARTTQIRAIASRLTRHPATIFLERLLLGPLLMRRWGADAVRHWCRNGAASLPQQAIVLPQPVQGQLDCCHEQWLRWTVAVLRVGCIERCSIIGDSY